MAAADRAEVGLTVRTLIVVILTWLTASILLGLFIGAVIRERDRER